MLPSSPIKTPRKHRPNGLEILYEDRDLIVVNKEAGVLTIATRNEELFTAENVLNDYVRKGCARSSKCVYLVHRLDRGTSGVLIFAKSEAAQEKLKDQWKGTEKHYLAAVRGHLKEKSGLLSSYLAEDENLFVRSVAPKFGRLSQTLYTVIRESPDMSLVKIRLLTGRRNQIRVQFADIGHPLVGDTRYGRNETSRERLCLHAKSIAFNHPHNGERLTFDTPIPDIFTRQFRGFSESEWAAAKVPPAPASTLGGNDQTEDEEDARPSHAPRAPVPRRQNPPGKHRQ